MWKFGYDLFDFDVKENLGLIFKTGVARHTEGERTVIMSKTKKGLVKFLCELEYRTGNQYPNESDLEEINEGIYKL